MNSKSILQIGKLLTILSLVTITFFGCQNEAIEVTPSNDQNTITVNSDLAGLLLQTVSLDGSFDNVLDGANCITINLPVTVIVNGVEIIIDSEADYEVIEAIFDEFTTDEDGIEIVFPIVIVLNDYTTVEIANQEELETFIDDCLGENEEDDDIECIDFQYPIVFSIYDSNFQITETVIIENDEALYQFIENLEAGVLVSLNFPVTMILSDGSTIEINSNEELQAAIEAAENDCDEDDDNDWNDDDENEVECSQDDIENYLLSCSQVLTLNDFTPVLTQFSFLENNNLSTFYQGDLPNSGTWDVSTSVDDVIVTINFSPSPYNFLENISNSWTVVECTENYLVLEHGDDVLLIESVCNNPCYSGAAELTECNPSGTAAFDLTTAFGDCNLTALSYYETAADAQSGINQLASPNMYVNISNPQTIYVPIPAPFGAVTLYEIELLVENCDTACDELAVDDYLQTCLWNVVNYNGSNDLIIYDLDFQENGIVIITGDSQTITSIWSTATTNDGVWVAFDGVNGANIQAITGNWLVVDCDTDRLEFVRGNDTMVMEQECN